MREISQEQFDKAGALMAEIDRLRGAKRAALTLQEKLNIQFEISRLIEERYAVLDHKVMP